MKDTGCRPPLCSEMESIPAIRSSIRPQKGMMYLTQPLVYMRSCRKDFLQVSVYPILFGPASIVIRIWIRKVHCLSIFQDMWDCEKRWRNTILISNPPSRYAKSEIHPLWWISIFSDIMQTSSSSVDLL